MPRRPDLAQAILWAGLICLVVFLSGHVWGRENPKVPVRPDQPVKPMPRMPVNQFSWRAANWRR
jgi:hypothetical protein